MLKLQRQDQLLNLVNARGLVSITEASTLLGVSAMTARRDMDELSAEGKLRRVRGGVKSMLPTPKEVIEQPHGTKQLLFAKEKHAIAKLAASMVVNGTSVYIGSGTTCELIPQYLGNKTVRVATNSFPVFNELKNNPNAELVLLGGLYREKTEVFYGPVTESALAPLNLDYVFMGVNGIDGSQLTAHNTEIVQLQRLVFDKGKHCYIVADSSKFGKRDFYTFYDLSDIDGVITDTKLSDSERSEYEAYTHVIRA